MPDLFNVGSSTAVAVNATPTYRKTVFNASGSTIYYKATSDVATTDTAVTVGSSVTTESVLWFISGGSTNVIVTDAAEDLTLDDLATDVITPASITPPSSPGGVANWQPVAATSGTDTTPASGTQFVTSLFIPYTFTITNINYLIGSVGGTDKVYGVLYSSSGAVLANTSLTSGGATVGTAANIQTLALTATYSAIGPARYFVGISMNGNTARLRTIPAFCQAGRLAGQVAQTHGTVAAITPPTTFTADKGPVVFVD